MKINMNKKFIDSVKIIILVAVLTIGGGYAYAIWQGPPSGTPPTCPDGYQGCSVPINEGTINQIKQAGLGLWGRFSTRDKAAIGLEDPTTMTASLTTQVNGKVGADAYCDQAGNNCIIPPGGGGSGFWQVDPTDPKAIVNTNQGKTNILSKIRISGGNPADGKVLVAQDNTGLARWRNVNELIEQTTFAAGCPAGKAIQAIKADQSVVCVDITTKTTTTGNSFLANLSLGGLLGDILNPPGDGGGSCISRVNPCTSGNGTCIDPQYSNNNGLSCARWLCCN